MSTPKYQLPKYVSTAKMSTSQNVNSQNVNFFFLILGTHIANTIANVVTKVQLDVH